MRPRERKKTRKGDLIVRVTLMTHEMIPDATGEAAAKRRKETTLGKGIRRF
jgi:hypothetical protein